MKNGAERVKIDSIEEERLQQMAFYESRLRSLGYSLIAGVDEAGRGPLAGPVVAAACILPADSFFPGLNDSKKISSQKREALFEQLINHPYVLYGLGIVSSERIDAINILQATFEAMQHSVKALSQAPDYLLIDGNQLPQLSCPSQAIIRGDSLSISIAAASVIAKVTRDRIMKEASLKWPEYGFAKHMGYGTKGHLGAIDRFGLCPIHRKSFRRAKRMSENRS